jgi:MFS family permease
LALVPVCLGYLMVILDTTIVNVAVPAVRAGLRTDTADLEWVIDGYLLMLAALVLSGGALADRIGARRVSQVGLAGIASWLGAAIAAIAVRDTRRPHRTSAKSARRNALPSLNATRPSCRQHGETPGLSDRRTTKRERATSRDRYRR